VPSLHGPRGKFQSGRVFWPRPGNAPFRSSILRLLLPARWLGKGRPRYRDSIIRRWHAVNSGNLPGTSDTAPFPGTWRLSAWDVIVLDAVTSNSTSPGALSPRGLRLGVA